MNQIISIGFLLIICITVLLVAAPFIDHVFYVHHKIEEIEKYETKFHWGHVWGFLIRYISPVAVFLVFCAKFV